MAKIIVSAQTEHIYHIANNMNPADKDECAALGLGPFKALLDSFHRSVISWTGMVDDRPVCMFGVSPIDILGGIGCPWLLGTDELKKHAKTFMKLNRLYVPKMLDLFPVLSNYVDVRHETAIRWLKWLGFRFDPEPIEYGVSRLPFYKFKMEKEDMSNSECKSGMRIEEVAKGTERIKEVWELLSKHRDELATHKELMVLKPDIERYREFEEKGSLVSLALYDGLSIVGYSVTIINKALHYSDLVCAQNDVLYLDPKYRHGMWGVRLIKRTEQAARKRGAGMIFFHGKENTAFSALMPRLGYGVQDIIFSREL